MTRRVTGAILILIISLMCSQVHAEHIQYISPDISLAGVTIPEIANTTSWT